MSRQSDSASLDFLLLKGYSAKEMSDWAIAESYHRRQSIASVVKDVFLVATSRACILDGYNPAVSIPKVDPDLVVIQLWHAFGAIKKFGWQAAGTSAGRPMDMATGLRMHSNYSYIVASGRGCVSAFTEAFCCAEDKIKLLGLPKMDYLSDNQDTVKLISEALGLTMPDRLDKHRAILEKHPELSSGKINALYVPTLRGKASKPSAGGTVDERIRLLSAALSHESYNLIVNRHPVDNGSYTTEQSFAYNIPSANSIDLLELADYVITDYSAIAFEAALLKKKVLFFVPDIEEYRHSPGLNIDVEQQFPEISFRSANDLETFITQDRSEKGSGELYNTYGFWSFCSQNRVDESIGATYRVGDFIRSLLNQSHG
jgi:CDP-ribitol ribitolphosphotransferase